MVSGHDWKSEISLTNATVGIVQLSASSVTTSIFGNGTSEIHETVIGTGLLAVGKIVSSIVINCVTLIAFPHTS